MDVLAPDEAELDVAWVALHACAAAATVPRSAAAKTDAAGEAPDDGGGSAVLTAREVEKPSLDYRQACQVAMRIRIGLRAPILCFCQPTARAGDSACVLCGCSCYLLADSDANTKKTERTHK